MIDFDSTQISKDTNRVSDAIALATTKLLNHCPINDLHSKVRLWGFASDVAWDIIEVAEQRAERMQPTETSNEA